MISIQDEQTQNEIIRDTVQRERSRLSRFIRSRLPDPDVAENVLQDVFHELTEAYRLTRPIERVASWLFAVARNKINDWYRKPRPISLDAPLNTGDQMVAELGVPLNALLSRKRYAVLHLRERLRDLYDELNDQ